MAAGQRGKAEELRRLHTAAELLVLVNVWDVVSARVVAGTPGCRAIATASWSIAAALGYRDHEEIPREDMPLVINARTDVFLARVGSPEEQEEVALERGRAYLEAGADCVFVPGLADVETIERLVAGLGRVSVLAGAHGPAPREPPPPRGPPGKFR